MATATKKKKAVKKTAATAATAKKATKKKTAKKATPSSNGELSANEGATLKKLAAHKGARGLNRDQLQTAIKAKKTGYPKLIALGYVVEQQFEDSRKKFFTATAKGRAAAKKL